MFKKINAILIAVLLLAYPTAFGKDTYGGYTIPVDIEINGSFIRCDNKPILLEGTTYIPLRAFSDAIGGNILWDETQMAAAMEKDGHSFVFYLEKGYCLIDGVERQYSSVLESNLTFVPVRAVSEVLGYDVSWDSFYLTVKIAAPGVEVPEECKDFSYIYDDILYLGKITQIESGSQHFMVKLGVAATVMNRVKSPKFPDCVKDVIFDTKYGVQFPPVHTEKINVTPNKESMIAAKCALFGVNPVESSLYFIDTKYAASSWVHNNRPHCVTLYDMSFYQ